MEVDSASFYNDSIVSRSSRVEEDLIMRQFTNEVNSDLRPSYFDASGTMVIPMPCNRQVPGSYEPYWSYDLDIIYVDCPEEVKVGIGTNDPLQRLHVAGNQYLTGMLGINKHEPDHPLDVLTHNTPDQKIANFVHSGVTENQFFVVPKLSAGSFNDISLDNDFGLFWSDHTQQGLGQEFDWNTDAGLVIAPWRNDVGTKGIRIAGDGKVGIGTNSPVNKLDVEGNQYISGNLGIGISSPIHKLEVDGDQYVSGSLGIGTSSPSDPLEVAGVIRSSDGGRILKMFAHGSLDFTALRSSNQSGDHVPFYLQTGTGATQLAVHDNKVGIGTDAPTKRLEVTEGVLLISGSPGTDTGARLQISTSDNTQDFIKFVNTDGDMLLVNNEGKLFAHEIEVKLGSFPDYVFHDDYKLRSLQELEQYIKTHKHLPDIPSEKEVIENGLNLGEMDALLLQKVEELTLYVIELQNQIEKLKKQ